MRKLIWLAAVGVLAWAGAADAQLLSRPQGEFKTFLGKLEYDPAASCFKPRRPFTDDKYARESYLADAKRYLQCLNEAVENDLKYAEKAILAGHETATQEFLAEVRRGF